MYRDDTENLWDKYESIFDSEEKKASAFDKIAKNYYLGNFGSMQKSDIDVLMFSIFIEEILEQTEEDINTYSDYALAKQLGITQSKVCNLKQKKQLQYPYGKFDWKKSFQRCCSNARLDGGKIKINLRDINLYYELKNQIDVKGGYTETSLTRNLLVVDPAFFFELVQDMMSEDEINVMKKEIRLHFLDNAELIERMEKESWPKVLKSLLKDGIPDALFEIAKAISPGIVGTGLGVLKEALLSIKRNK